MTTEPEPIETPDGEVVPPRVEPAETPVVVAQERPTRRFYTSPVARVVLPVIAALLIFAGGFALGHWAFPSHEHRRPNFAARAQQFMQDMRQGRNGQSRNGPQMGQAPNLQQLLPLLEQLLNNRNNNSNNNGTAQRGSNSPQNDVQRQIQQLQEQVKQLQDQLKNSPR